MNTVELVGFYGSDETHALSAWTSTSRDLTDEKRGRMDKLLGMLARDGHHTPFEKSYLHFLVTCDTASHIHILKHRVGVSCVSGDTLIHVPKPGGGYSARSIRELWERQSDGIRSVSSRGVEYRRQYGRPIPVRSKDPASNLVVKSHIQNVFYNGKRPVFEFTTESGKSIKTTLDHRFYTPDGWREIGEYLGVALVAGERAVFSNVGALVATNGVRLDDPKRPWTSRSFFEDVEGVMTRTQAAQHLGLKYVTLKKWGYIHGIEFLEDENKGFPSGNVPWNRGVYGYSAPRKSHGLNRETIEAGAYKDRKVWRAAVGNWTREQLPKLMEKYSYQCQGPLSVHERDFQCHHIVPVSQDPSLSLEFDNLLLMCSACHKWAHESVENTQWVADNYSSYEVSIEKVPRKGRKLSIGFEEVVKVRFCGVEDVYDLEVPETHSYVANGFMIHNCNGESARYKELDEDKWHVPQDWPDEWRGLLHDHAEASFDLYHDALHELTTHHGFDRKRAKESARFFLPYASQLTLDVGFNFRSFMHFLGLRAKDDAQDEIHEIADNMLRLVRETGQFDMSLEGFGYG